MLESGQVRDNDSTASDTPGFWLFHSFQAWKRLWVSGTGLHYSADKLPPDTHSLHYHLNPICSCLNSVEDKTPPPSPPPTKITQTENKLTHPHGRCTSSDGQEGAHHFLPQTQLEAPEPGFVPNVGESVGQWVRTSEC